MLFEGLGHGGGDGLDWLGEMVIRSRLGLDGNCFPSGFVVGLGVRPTP